MAFDALKDITTERLRALHTVMPLLAEAAPEAFIEAMEADLNGSDSAQRALLNFGLVDSEGKSHTPIPRRHRCIELPVFLDAGI